jgi:predicted kinase
MPLTIHVPFRTLLVLCGPAGSGKSTFASQRFRPSMIVSSDACREMVCDDAANQQVNRDTFDLFYYIINKRMFNSRFTVADSTALYADARHKLLDLAHHHGYLSALLIFSVSEQTVIERNRGRTRSVEPQVIPYHARLLQQTLLDAPNEGWDRLYMLGENTTSVKVEISESDGGRLT